MPSTQNKIDTLSEISQQLRDEGADEQIIAMAEGLAKGQFGSSRNDKIGAIKLMMDALAFMLVRSPMRPTCCAMCEVEYIRSSLQVLALCYSGAMSKEREKRDGKA